MYCTKCGAEVKTGSVYCPNCGAKMKQNAPKKLFVFGCTGRNLGESDLFDFLYFVYSKYCFFCVHRLFNF